MRFQLTSSSWGGSKNRPEYIEVASLDELLNVAIEAHESIILHPPSDGDPEWTLEIYDDWRE